MMRRHAGEEEEELELLFREDAQRGVRRWPMPSSELERGGRVHVLP